MPKRKNVIEMRDAAKSDAREELDKVSQRDASTIIGRLWGQMIVASLDKLGWTPTKFHKRTGISRDSYSRWRRGIQEPKPPNDKIIADLWESELSELGKTKQ